MLPTGEQIVTIRPMPLQKQLSRLLLFLLPGGLTASNDLKIDLLLEAPDMAQPSFLNFDERGRMWVMQYRQYPFPAGVKLLSKDQFWRSTYDRKIPPPGTPDYPRGKDRITIHEDKDGDGSYENSEVFLDGLNFCTSFVRGNKGTWVLQPPYLLFFEDGKSDEAPAVHLDGFGIQDSHAIATALNWGPDGWLYGCQGSTVSLNIQEIKRQGQLIWRYHPDQQTFEIFAEGGGNIWSCEFDSVGRLYAGSNNKYAGYWYHQGAYYGKNIGKHGGLSNPHAYGYLDGIPHKKYQRVTTSIMIYEGQTLPKRFHSSLVFANPLTDGVGAYTLSRSGLSIEASPLEIIDVLPWKENFRPVYLDFGPDGAIYVCDWQDTQVNHMQNTIGQMSPNDGRIFRIRHKDSKPQKPFDLNKEETLNLLPYLKHQNRWWRETARRVLSHRNDKKAAIPLLKQWLNENKGQTALEALWALNLCGGLDDETFAKAIVHNNPHVRRWTIRLAGDLKKFSTAQWNVLVSALPSEAHPEVLAQLAATAARIPPEKSALLIEHLLTRHDASRDRQFILQIWWAMEKHLLEIPDTFLKIMGEPGLISGNPFWPTLASYMTRRFASEDSREHLNRCATLLDLARNLERKNKDLLWNAFESAFKGRPMRDLPETLLEVFRREQNLPLHLQLRLKIPGANEAARKQLQKINNIHNHRIIEYFGEFPDEEILALVLSQLNSNQENIVKQTLSTLQAYPHPEVASKVIEKYPTLPPQLREAASVLLLSRTTWTTQWLNSLAQNPDFLDDLPDTTVTSLQHSNIPAHRTIINKLWPSVSSAAEPHDTREITRIRKTISEQESGDLHRGKTLFTERCASCHELHDTGGEIGPGLTEYQRQNLDTLLQAIVSPNLEIREGYESYLVETTDGRSLSGFLKKDDKHIITLQPIGGLPISVGKEKIKLMNRIGTSLMPSGLLNGLSDQELLDFFAYLQSTQPLPPKR